MPYILGEVTSATYYRLACEGHKHKADGGTNEQRAICIVQRRQQRVAHE